MPSRTSRDYEPPTDEQLERFIEVMLAGQAARLRQKINAPWGARMVMQNPILKDEWLRRHRELQEASWASR